MPLVLNEEQKISALTARQSLSYAAYVTALASQASTQTLGSKWLI